MASQILSTQELKSLNIRSNLHGFIHLVLHLGVTAVTGYLWVTNFTSHWYIGIPALIAY